MPEPIVPPVTPPVTPPVVTPEPAVTPPVDLARAVEGLIAKHGDRDTALRVLLNENFGEREKVRDLKSRMPSDGARVLTAAEAAVFAEYEGIGKPADLKLIKKEHGTQAGELATSRRDAEIRAFADKAGVKPAVLAKLAGTLDLTKTVKVKDAKTGKESEVPAVKDGDKEPVAFAAYAAATWPDFMAALHAQATPIAAPTPGNPRRQAAPLPPVAGATPAAQPVAVIRMPRV